jgi:hypothetical protein
MSYEKVDHLISRQRRSLAEIHDDGVRAVTKAGERRQENEEWAAGL